MNTSELQTKREDETQFFLRDHFNCGDRVRDLNNVQTLRYCRCSHFDSPIQS